MSDLDEELIDDQGFEGLNAEALIHRAIDQVNAAKAMPLSASVLVQRDDLISILEVSLERLPVELKEARWLLREREEFLAEQAREAQQMMEEVKAQAERMVSRTDIVRQANKVAQRILDDANEESRRMRHETEDYCDQRLAQMEIVLDRIMRTVRSGRQKLQATATPKAAEPMEQAIAGHQGESEENPFFDQDLA